MLATRHSIPTVVAGDKEVNEPRSDGSTERFEMVSAFLNAFSDAALLLDADGIILAVNDITVERFSTSAAALIGTFAYDIPPADALHARRKWITEVVSSGAPMHAQELYEGRRFRVSLYPVATRNGSVTRVLMLKHDVTEERDVIDERQRLALLDAANDAIIIFDLDGHIKYWNKGAERQYGWKQDDVRGELIHSLLQTVFPSPLEDVTDHLFRVGRWEGELRHTTRSGVAVTVKSHWTLQYGARNVPEAILETARDITEQKHVEDKLRAASLYARSLIEASLDPLVTINADGKITDVNKATEEVTGLSREELIESDFSNYFTEPEKANAGYRQVFTDGFVRDYPLAIRHKSGRITDVLYNATLFKNELDEIQGVFAAARDITERKQVEQQLKEHAQRTSVLNDIIRVINEASDLPTLFGPALATTFERLGFAAGFIATENERGRLQVRYAHNLPWTFVESLDRVDIDTNPYIRRVHRKGELIVWDELPVDALAARYGLKGGAVVLPIFSGGVPIGEFVVYAMRPLLLKPEERNLLLTIATEFGTALSKLEAQEAVRHYADELAKYSAHLEELVEERTAQLKDAERLVGIGETAAMIGHDLRNPLQVLQYIVDLQRLRFERMSPSERSLDEWEKEQELFAKISEQVFYMDKIVGDLQDYARPIVPEREEIAIKTLIEDVIQSLPAMDGVRITMDVEGLRVEADSHLMHRVFANLLLNAVQAMPDGGTLTVSAVVEDGSVAISVRDTGTGIRTELQDKLFKPLFTSKAKGTGLGLAVVKRIVEAHDGQVTVESEVGKGSTFTVRLPATEELKRERDSSS